MTRHTLSVLVEDKPGVLTRVASLQISTGFKGSFDIWNDYQWNWEIGFDYGHVHNTTTTYGLPGLTALNQATGPSFYDEETGTVRCGC